MRDMKEFGQLISKKRKQAGLTQNQFAEKLGITPQAVSKWENGVGYPDVTLFPMIAEILGMSIEELFLDRGRVSGAYIFPQYYEDMPFVFAKENKACYSSKEVEKIDERGGVIIFADGSEADIPENRVFNRGQGEVRFFAIEKVEEPHHVHNGVTEIDEVLPPFSSIEISNNLKVDVKVISVDVGEPRIIAKGSERFISLLKYRVSNDTLWIEWKERSSSAGSKKNVVEIYVDFKRGKKLKCSINGSGKCDIEPDFDNASVSINGSGIITGHNCGKLKCDINGSGDIIFGNVEENTELAINGSGRIKIDSSHIAYARINGSGDIDTGINENATLRLTGSGTLKTVMAGGDYNVKSLGAGVITVSGEAQTFYCGLQGNETVLDGKELSVEKADIHSKGEVQMYLKAIRQESIEKIRPGGMLVVGKRGE